MFTNKTLKNVFLNVEINIDKNFHMLYTMHLDMLTNIIN